MIKVTLKQLVTAMNTNVSNGAGSLGRFYACPKAISVSERWAARKAPAQCDGFVKDFKEQELALYKQHGDEEKKEEKDKDGKVALKPTGNIKLRDAEIPAFTKAREELLAQEVELDGAPVAVPKLLGDSLVEVDLGVLEPWIAEK